MVIYGDTTLKRTARTTRVALVEKLSGCQFRVTRDSLQYGSHAFQVCTFGCCLFDASLTCLSAIQHPY
jgi:hypothetical protein